MQNQTLPPNATPGVRAWPQITKPFFDQRWTCALGYPLYDRRTADA